MVNNMRGVEDLVLGLKQMVLSPERVANFRSILADYDPAVRQWSDEEVEVAFRDMVIAVAVVRYQYNEIKHKRPVLR
jgi:hypothetical protein